MQGHFLSPQCNHYSLSPGGGHHLDPLGLEPPPAGCYLELDNPLAGHHLILFPPPAGHLLKLVPLAAWHHLDIVNCYYS